MRVEGHAWVIVGDRSGDHYGGGGTLRSGRGVRGAAGGVLGGCWCIFLAYFANGYPQRTFQCWRGFQRICGGS